MEEAVTAGAVLVVVSTEEVSAVAVSTAALAFTGEASGVALSTAALAFVGDVSAVVVSTAVALVVAVLVDATGVATGAITGSLMMSSSAASAFRPGGAGAIRTDITVTTITHTITMDTADIHLVTMDTVGTRTAMDTAGTVTTVAPVMDIAMEAEQVMDMALAAEPVTDTAMAADQGIRGVRGVGDNRGVSLGVVQFALATTAESEPEAIVLLVGANPKPIVFAVAFACDGSVAPAYLNRVDATFLLKA